MNFRANRQPLHGRPKPQQGAKHRSSLRLTGERIKAIIPKDLGGKRTLINGPMNIEVRSQRTQLYGLRYQPIPLHDFLNFKKMTSNEILLNLDNNTSLTNSELIGGLLELTKRDREQRFDWTEHPITAACLKDLKQRQPRLSGKHIAQAQLIMQQMRVKDEAMWQTNAEMVIRMLHCYKTRDMAQFLDIFDRDILDDEGEPIGVKKTADDTFFERIVGLLPMHVKEMNHEQVIRTLEVLTARNLGSERLFDHYILFMIEKYVLRYSVSTYSRMIRVMADREFVEDFVFWDKYAFRYVFTDPRRPEGRFFTHEEAKLLWDSMVYLKLKCPTIDIRDALNQLEQFIDNTPRIVETVSE